MNLTDSSKYAGIGPIPIQIPESVQPYNLLHALYWCTAQFPIHKERILSMPGPCTAAIVGSPHQTLHFFS